MRPPSTSAGRRGREPVLVVGRRQVPGRVHPLDRMPEPPVQVPRQHGGDSEPVGPTLPVGVEHRLVRLNVDRAESLHPTEVVDPIHGPTSEHTAAPCARMGGVGAPRCRFGNRAPRATAEIAASRERCPPPISSSRTLPVSGTASGDGGGSSGTCRGASDHRQRIVRRLRQTVCYDRAVSIKAGNRASASCNPSASSAFTHARASCSSDASLEG